MSYLLAENPEAQAWVDRKKTALRHQGVFGQLKGAVVWSDVTGADGNLLVPVDPDELVANINANGWPLLKGHDPGFPLGKVLAAEAFTCASGQKFVAAVFGFYDGARLSFHDLRLDQMGDVASPTLLPGFPDNCWITLATDPREVDADWINDVVRSAPIPVKQTEVSHNAADTAQDLIQIGVLFLALIWNPFVTAVASEAGKDAYANLRRWLRGVLNKLSERRSPILEIQSHHNDCHISFLFRGSDVRRNYAAFDFLPVAAAHAQNLVRNMKKVGLPPKLIVYEFHPQEDKWFPSFAELRDGRLVTDNSILIATERLPSGLSLGISRDKNRSGLPSVKELP